ncbi:16S rRNA (cytidine(1402)-2'-O)-methyltransferase [Candidatus Parcubacteria bacterium]|nr:MAG: 16S rRNA (cytidine(1402)-2'-O)-methyltransferase [Candidatus Parcubacteria bacterium]
MGTLYIVATPIGNLEDMTFRAVRILMEVDFVLAEDTRVAKKLLDHFNVKKPIVSYWQHNQLKRLPEIIEALRSRKKIALTTDAGTPAISDPGAFLVDGIYKALGNQVKIEAVPGPSAVTTALSIAGFPAEKFLFLGFPPSKRKRNKFFSEVAKYPETVVFYESPHRLIKSLNDLAKVLVKSQDRSVVVCKELTKQFEYIFRGVTADVLKQLQEVKVKGEFVVVVGPKNTNKRH